MASDIVGADLIERLALSLVHSLWQGTLIALAAAWLRLLVTSPRVRYGFSAGALLAMLAAPAVTFLVLSTAGSASPLTLPKANGDAVLAAFAGTGDAAGLPWTRWLVMAWLCGVAACLFRLVGAWRATRRLVAQAAAPAAPFAIEMAARLSARLQLRVPVRLLQSMQIDTPVAIGWLRPVVLLPAAAVTGLTTAQLEAVLAHELAHVRRHDFLVNIVQRCVESLLFYHPAVWWLSASIRADREECCDDVALASCPDTATYTSALLELERARSVAPLAMAGTGGSLSRRIRRLLDRTAPARDWRDVLPTVALVAALAVTALYGTNGLRAQPVPPDAAPAAAQSPAPSVAPEAAENAPDSEVAVTADRFFFSTDTDSSMSWVLLRNADIVMRGSSGDAEAARAARERHGSDLLWFRLPEGAYVVRDPRIVERVLELQQPQRELAEQQAAEAAQQRRLAEEMSNARVEIGTASLEARLREFAGHLPATATPRELGEMQRALGEMQRELGRLQGEAGREQARLGRLQAEHGRRQAELGRQQAEAARHMNREVRELLTEALASGAATPE